MCKMMLMFFFLNKHIIWFKSLLCFSLVLFFLRELIYKRCKCATLQSQAPFPVQQKC